MNWTNKLEEMQKLVDNWRIRKLTLYGKICIIKSLLIPKIIFVALLLPIPENMVKDVNKILYKFIWGNTDRIKRRVLINKKVNGGLQMMDIESQFYSLKAAWMPRISMNQNLIWSKLATYFMEKIAPINVIKQMSFTEFEKLPCLKAIPKFYREVICGISKAHKVETVINKNDLYRQILWGNNLFKVKNHCLYNKTFINSGIIYVYQILNENGSVKKDIYNILNNKRHYFRTLTLVILALKPYNMLRFQQSNIILEDNKRDISNYKSKHFYSEIIDHKVCKPKSNTKWENEFHCEINWSNIYCFKLKIIHEAKIREFNYKILLNILATNDNLYRWKIINSKYCIYCKGTVIHNEKHLLWECAHLKSIWQMVFNALHVTESWKNVIFGIPNKYVENIIISILAYLIYKKFQIDKANVKGNFEPLYKFLSKELVKKTVIYKTTKHFDVSNKLQLITELLHIQN